ncbi:hypothetical protein DFH08DRAFT_843520 [Mycena albidolilacea]|uniref:Uncharacterized protein n=1 Tax=Mycena albidolilacea TaxID=1033008 RepID=A0AAD7AKE7_9AGAR|nr:hypothetical protein DFH08DRAFT_843520 [Mycena albidolilacea]
MCPPGVDQTTRSSPLWTFLAPGLGQKQKLPSDRKERWYDAGPLGFFNSGLSWDAFGKLAHVGRDSKSPFLLRQLVRAPVMSSRLEKLAAELLCIISAGLDVDDLIALGLCSQTLWCIAMCQLQDEYQRRKAPWAGTPIICTSTHLTSVPDSFRQVNPGLIEEMEAWEVRRQMATHRTRMGMSPIRRWNWGALNDYSEVVDVHSLSSQCLAAFSAKVESSGIPKKLQATLQRTMTNDLFRPSSVHNRSKWVLRNLDTKEVVHFQAVKREGFKDTVCLAVSGLPWLTLDFVLTLRILWPDLNRYNDPQPSNVKVGAWAGHKFDVVEAATLEPGESWQDVTEDIAREAETTKPNSKSLWWITRT